MKLIIKNILELEFINQLIKNKNKSNCVIKFSVIFSIVQCNSNLILLVELNRGYKRDKLRAFETRFHSQ